MKKLFSLIHTTAWSLTLFALLASKVHAQSGFIAITNAAGYSQNFDSMGSGGTSTPPGWYVGTNTSAISGTNVTVSDGSINSGTNYNFGLTAASDRALGSLASGSGDRNTEARFVNQSGVSIASLTISYTGEQWRQGGGGAVNNALVLHYGTDGSNFTAMGTAYDFNSPYDSGPPSALDGNQPTNRVTGIGGTYVPAALITNGQAFYLRWVDANDPSNDHGLAIDDLNITVTFNANPPVATTLLASDITHTSATLNGSINPNGSPTSAWFQWGATANYGSNTVATLLPASGNYSAVSNAFSGFPPGGLYHFRVVASNSAGMSFGDDHTWPIDQHAYLKSSNPAIGGFFGKSVSVSGDTMVIGAPGYVSGGAALVFVRNGGAWTQQALLQATTNINRDGVTANFGGSVAISGNTLVIGAYGEDSNATGVNGNPVGGSYSDFDSGAAYIFVRSGTNWSQQAYLKASNTGPRENFGYAVAISGETIVVGAPNENSSATGVNGNQNINSCLFAGAAYVFLRSGTNWSQQAYLKAPDTRMYGGFGDSVAIADDTVVIGAVYRGESLVVRNVNIFSRSGTNWSQEDAISPGGTSVSVSGQTLVIGNRENSLASIYVRNGSSWEHQQDIGVNFSVGFGASVAVANETIVIGNPYEDRAGVGVNGLIPTNGANNSGAAYVFVRSGTNWFQRAYLKASNTGEYDFFGWSVAASSEVIVVGAFSENSITAGNQSDESAPGSGAAYTFNNFIVSPEISVEQPAGTSLLDGLATVDFGNAVATNSQRVFTIKNLGSANLTAISATIDGPNAAEFSVTSAPAALVSGLTNTSVQSTTFTVNLSPGPVGTGTAALHITSNDADESPFDISLSFTRVPVPPSSQTEPATGISTVAAILHGSVIPYTLASAAWFEWGTTTNFGNTTASTNLSPGFTAVPFSATIAGLTLGTTYYFRVVATNAAGTNYGSRLSFMADFVTGPEISVEQPVGTNLLDGAATVDFGNAVASNSQRTFTIKNFGYASLNGISVTIDGPNGAEFSVVTPPASQILGPSGLSLSSVRSANFTVKLSPGPPGTGMAGLHIASNDADESPFDLNLSFTRVAFAPSIVPQIITNVSINAATLEGTVIPNFLDSAAWFEWGTTTNYGTRTVSTNLGSGGVAVSFSTAIAGLTTGTTYYYRVVATNAVGTNYGIGQWFVPEASNVVTTLNDTGAGSLRQCIAQSATGSTITFATTGGVSLNGPLVLEKNVTIVGPGAGDFAIFGLITNELGVATSISGVSIIGGAGLYNKGTLTLTDCVIGQSLYAITNFGSIFGLGIENRGSLKLNRCTIQGTIKGIINFDGDAELVSCTVSYNGSGAGYGNSIEQLGFASSLKITACTIANNSDEIEVYAGTCTIQNSIIAGNSVGVDIVGINVQSLGHNLIGRLFQGYYTNGATGDLVGTTNAPLDPMLGPLANNGSGTPTHVLLPGSPALERGDDSLLGAPFNLITDQRGQPRQADAHVDIGAVEFDRPAFTATTLPPTIGTNNPVTAIAPVNLNAGVNPAGLPASASFEYGLTPSYGATTSATSPGFGINSVAVTSPAISLSAGLTYHYRVVVTNFLGTFYGAMETFTMPALPFAPGDANGDGVVSQVEFDAVFTNYLQTSPWVYMTNVVGLSGTNVNFELLSTTAGVFSVEYTTNLTDWRFLGPTTPKYEFTDTNAPFGPQRYYRLRWP